MYRKTVRFPRKNDVRFALTPTCFVEGSCFIYIICIYLRIVVSATISIAHGVLTCCVTVAWWVSLVEQELITLPEYLNSPLDFIDVPGARSLFFCVGFCRSFFCPLCLAIVCVVLLQFTVSNYTFDIFNLLLYTLLLKRHLIKL